MAQYQKQTVIDSLQMIVDQEERFKEDRYQKDLREYNSRCSNVDERRAEIHAIVERLNERLNERAYSEMYRDARKLAEITGGSMWGRPEKKPERDTEPSNTQRNAQRCINLLQASNSDTVSSTEMKNFGLTSVLRFK